MQTEDVALGDVNEETDVQLVRSAWAGDIESFGRLYERHYAFVVAAAMVVLADHHLAEDAAQETFATACRQLHRLRRPESFAKWLRGICRNVSRNLLRARVRRRKAEASALRPRGNPGAEPEKALWAAVGRLSTSAREVVLLHYFGGMTHAQIASALGTSPQAVHGRLVRARRKIARDLKGSGLERNRS